MNTVRCFGTDGFLAPFSLLQKDINIAKGHLFKGNAPVSIAVIKKLAEAFVKADTRQAADKLMSTIKKVRALRVTLAKSKS